jgi:hypothetical protein
LLAIGGQGKRRKRVRSPGWNQRGNEKNRAKAGGDSFGEKGKQAHLFHLAAVKEMRKL